jgi:hypothetical protein
MMRSLGIDTDVRLSLANSRAAELREDWRRANWRRANGPVARGRRANEAAGSQSEDRPALASRPNAFRRALGHAIVEVGERLAPREAAPARSRGC